MNHLNNKRFIEDLLKIIAVFIAVTVIATLIGLFLFSCNEPVKQPAKFIPSKVDRTNYYRHHKDTMFEIQDDLSLMLSMADTMHSLRGKSMDYALKGNKKQSKYYERKADAYASKFKKRWVTDK